MDSFLVGENFIKKFRTHSIIIGVLLMIAGITGIVLPQVASLTVSLFVGWLFVFGGLVSGYHVLKNYRRNWVAWFKPLILLLTGILLLLFPAVAIAAIGLLLIFYFLLDAFAGFSAAHELHGRKGWGWMLVNAVLSLVLAVILLVGWPFSSVWLVGLFVGVSLLMDGIVLFVLGISVHLEV